MKNKKGGHSVTGGLKMRVNVVAHTRHVLLGSAPPPTCQSQSFVSSRMANSYHTHISYIKRNCISGELGNLCLIFPHNIETLFCLFCDNVYK